MKKKKKKFFLFVPNVVNFEFMQNILEEMPGVLVPAEAIGHNQDQWTPASLNKLPERASKKQGKLHTRHQ